VIDIGGGMYGGALQFFKGGENRLLFDYLADVYVDRKKLPTDIKAVKGNFDKLPFPDNSVDVIFAWEVLDHALTKDHFIRGQKEIVRVLKNDGLLFFNHPIPQRKKKGHTIIVNPNQILNGFKDLQLVNPTTSLTRKHVEFCAIFTKSEYKNHTYRMARISIKFGSKIHIETKHGSTSINRLDLISIGELRVQHNQSRYDLYRSLHTCSEENVLSMDQSPHIGFLDSMHNFYDGDKISIDDVVKTRYYKMHILYGKTHEEAIVLCGNFLVLYEDIKKNGLKCYPLVARHENSYEIFEGHHRVAICLFLEDLVIECGVMEDRISIGKEKSNG
jgi:SAM-dependent methyltransferase